MLRALLLLACTAKVSAFATLPAGEQAGAGDPACVDLEPEAIQAEYAEALVEALEAGELPEGTTMASCADVAAGGGCDDESLAGFCCASCALPQRMTYGSRRRRLIVGVIIAGSGCSSSSEGSEDRGC